MSIDAATLDDNDSQEALQLYDSPQTSWNDHTLEWLSDALPSCLEVLSLQLPSMPQSLSSKPIFHLHKDSSVSTVVQPILTPSIGPSDWAAAQRLVKGYLQTAHLPKVTLASASEITGSISLQDLLSSDWFNHPIIPFNIPQEVPNFISPFTLTLPPLTQLELMNIPLTLDLQAFSVLYAHSQPLPGDLLKPPRGFTSRYPDEYYVRVQSEYYEKLQADCYNKLLAVQQAQITSLPNLPVPVVVAPPIDLHAIAAAKTLATPLPPELVSPPGHSRRLHQHYSKLQAEYYAKVEAECYAHLVAEQQAQIAPPPPPPRPESSQNQPFVSLIETKLAELRDPAYAEQFARPPYNEQFVAQLESKLGAAYHEYMVGVHAIETFFGRNQIALPPIHSIESTAPICEIPLLGYPDQRTVHFHCGIANNYASVVEGGLCLSAYLNREFAIQPYLVHSKSIIQGGAFVALEKFEENVESIVGGVVGSNVLDYIQAPKIILENSLIQRSIDFEVATLSDIAKNIIKRGDPNLKQVHVTFSNGGYVFNEALKQLSSEYQETIVVITAGTTTIIENYLACKVYNIIGDKDNASQTCIGGAVGIDLAKARANIQIVPQNETQSVVEGHYFIQGDYQQKISEIMESEILRVYEVY